jgi:polynucleotide kinase-phosphatase
MKLAIPELSLVVLIGPSGSGKTTFAAKQFLPSEVLSSDHCRRLVSDDENSLEATGDAFEVLRFIARKRLGRRLLTVVDATNVQAEARKPLIELARDMDVLPVAIVFDVPRSVCEERTAKRPDRNFGVHVIRRHHQDLKRSLKTLKREGFRRIHVLESVEAVDSVELERDRLWSDRRYENGPFDIIGDVHGCADELEELLQRLGYAVDAGHWRHPEGRKAIFVGDLVDRGPGVARVLRTVMTMVEAGTALCVAGNHEAKLLRKLNGKDVRVTHGLAQSLEQLANEPAEFRKQVIEFLDGLVSHYVLDSSRLVVAHAGLIEKYQGRASGRVREFALYGDTTGETDEFGLPVRYDWASDYRGEAYVVYGHTPVPEATWLNRTICIDTGCVFGGRLTALRYPERELMAVAARSVHYEPTRPLAAAAEAAPAAAANQRAYGDLLDIEDVCGKRAITTRYSHAITVREENAAAALEVMSRFAVDPRWLIYLPPTMSPTATVPAGALLEHPEDAFKYYRTHGVSELICEEKHMGSRAIVVLCRGVEAAKKRFGVTSDSERIGVIYTRTGRPFFSDPVLESQLLARIGQAVAAAGLWAELEADWICLDAELLPWSAKAQAMLKNQYAAVGAASRAGLSAAIAELEACTARGGGAESLVARFRDKLEMAQAFTCSYRRYCWPVSSLADLRLAPFHLLAAGDRVFVDRDHRWHMDTLAKLAQVDPDLFRATQYKVVDLNDSVSSDAATAWWTALTEAGGEGMVVKPRSFIVRDRKGLLQPAIKCRGREYLRIIYGPEYTAPENIERLRGRGLNRKRTLALREFALGFEALHRFVENEPLYRVHECVFSVLAFESEPVDPRL